MNKLETLQFLTTKQAQVIAKQYGTPVFVYSQTRLLAQAKAALALPAPYGLTVRYAMKANPNAHILHTFDGAGLQIDASSGFEAERAMLAGIAPDKILLTAQELTKNLVELIRRGVQFNACSLHQLETYGQYFPGSKVTVRINPGIGSGHSAKTNVGGPSSSFGIWHEQIPVVQQLLDRYRLTVERLHTHIGSGTDPAVWQRAAGISLEIIRSFPQANTINLGGGFKVARTQDETSVDMAQVGAVMNESLQNFYQAAGRKLHLEIEPGTFLVANAGSLITTVQDTVTTGESGYNFLKIDSGMTEVLRPSLYGAQHPIVIVSGKPRPTNGQYIVVGHACESGDLLTPAAHEPETLAPRLLQTAQIGDLLVIEGVGAYCSSMSAQNYNSYPTAVEIMLNADGSPQLIRRRQTMQQMLSLEEAVVEPAPAKPRQLAIER